MTSTRNLRIEQDDPHCLCCPAGLTRCHEWPDGIPPLPYSRSYAPLICVPSE